MNNSDMAPTVETHPLEPFLPAGAKVLMLGSFPPKKERWSIEFFYPNFINDMWRIIGLIFFDDKEHFIVKGEKRFDKDSIVEFCTEKGIAIYDTATKVKRLKDNASDKFLEVVLPTDINALLKKIPQCRNIVATGEKACATIAAALGCAVPSPGKSTEIQDSSLRLYRMPSSSRAYPVAIDKKAESYGNMFREIGLL